MDTRELQKLAEAYSQVHAPQEEIEEAVKGASPHTMQMRKDAAAERRAGIKPLPAKKGEEYAKYKMSQMAYAKRKRMGEEVEQIDEISADLALKASKAADIKRGKLAAGGDKEGAAGKAAQAKRLYDKQAKIRLNREELDIFDIVLEFLQTEGYAETLEQAEWMMANVIDEEAIDIILGEAQHARENPEKYEREQAKKTSKREKAMNDPHKGINSPAFAEFMKKQMGR